MSQESSGIKINGSDAKYSIQKIPLELLEVDPTNPRIGYYQDTIRQNGEELTPDKIIFAIQAGDISGYNSLKENIETNRGIMVEIWVYKTPEGKFRIVDGNTRYSIYRDLAKKYPSDPTWKSIPAKILSSDFDQRAVDFIRLTTHLQGENNWQTYERARYIYQLFDSGYDIEELARRTKLTRSDIKRWLNAYKEMEEEFIPVYSDSLDSPLSKFSYFDEYNKGSIKDLMSKNQMGIKDFCKWVGEEQILKAATVRDLPDMLKDPEITEVMREEGFASAYTQFVSHNPAKGSKLFDQIESVISGLSNLPLKDMISIQEETDSARRDLLNQLASTVNSLLQKINTE